jgi:lysophospholipase L1-like esterase
MALGAACGGSNGPGPGPTPPPGPPTISCPADRSVPAIQGQPTPVSFDIPAAENGQAPVTVTCAPASGSAFPLGSTQVTCTATDALQRTATCGFSVAVNTVPQIAVTKFVAFGDSLTEGTISPDTITLAVSKPESYPYQLQLTLAARYLDQTIEVVNEGCGGEFTSGASTFCAGGIARLPDVLARERPQVLLLMHGANDLRRPSRSISNIVGAMETMVGQAQAAGAFVFVASLPPQNPEGSRGDAAPRLPEYARELKRMAEDEGAGFVDLFNLLGTWQGVVGADGLHPTPAGYQKIARLWADAIEERFEKTDAPAVGFTRR